MSRSTNFIYYFSKRMEAMLVEQAKQSLPRLSEARTLRVAAINQMNHDQLWGEIKRLGIVMPANSGVGCA
jgi:hypothetical protein